MYGINPNAINGIVLDQDIENLESKIESLKDSNDQYLEALIDYFNHKLLKYKQKKISNSDLAVNGIETETSLIPVSEALGSFETALLMYDSADHKTTNGLCWKGVPTVRAGKKDKNHSASGGNSGKVLFSQIRPNPKEVIKRSMREIYPMFTSGTELHLERMRREGRKSPSTS